MAPKQIFTFEIATNAPTGLFKVHDRAFHDRRLTLSEKHRAMQPKNDASFLAVALSALKVEGEDVTDDWVADNLSEQDVALAVTYILGGAQAVQKLGDAAS